MPIFRQKPLQTVSPARTAGRCEPAGRRETPRLYPAFFSTPRFTDCVGNFAESVLLAVLQYVSHSIGNTCKKYSFIVYCSAVFESSHWPSNGFTGGQTADVANTALPGQAAHKASQGQSLPVYQMSTEKATNHLRRRLLETFCF